MGSNINIGEYLNIKNRHNILIHVERNSYKYENIEYNVLSYIRNKEYSVAFVHTIKQTSNTYHYFSRDERRPQIISVYSFLKDGPIVYDRATIYNYYKTLLFLIKHILPNLYYRYENKRLISLDRRDYETCIKILLYYFDKHTDDEFKSLNFYIQEFRSCVDLLLSIEGRMHPKILVN